MKKVFWFGTLFVLVLLVSACQAPPPAASDTSLPAATQAEENPAESDSQAVQEAGETSGAAECRPYNLLDDILTAPDPNLAPVTEDDHVLGPDDAKLTILEFSDFQ